jgi:hypothetical protein
MRRDAVFHQPSLTENLVFALFRVDVLPLLPAELSQDDVAALMERLPAVRGIRNGSGCRGPQGTATGGDAHGVVSDTVVASAPFVSRVQAQLVQYAQEVAHQTYQGAEALGTTAKTQQPGMLHSQSVSV